MMSSAPAAGCGAQAVGQVGQPVEVQGAGEHGQ